MTQLLRLKTYGIFLATLITAFLFCPGDTCAQGHTINVGPSKFCHVTEGAFTDCDTNTPGLEEWSDIDFLPWAGANVYTDQRVPPFQPCS